MELTLKGWHNTKLPDTYNEVILDLKKAIDNGNFERVDKIKNDLIKVSNKLNDILKKMKPIKTNNEKKLNIKIKSYETQFRRIECRLNMLQQELDKIKKMCVELK